MKTPTYPEADVNIEPLRQLRRELHESQQRYRSIVDSAFDAIITIDQQNLITEFNPAAEAMFGWTRQQVMGRDLGETIIPAALREAHRRGLDRYRDSAHAPRLGIRLELSALHAAGNEFPIELTVSRVEGGGAPKFTAVIRNLTARRAAEAEARALAEQWHASESQYRSLFVDNPQPMYVYDAPTLRLVAVNTAALAQYGFTEAEFLQLTVADLRPAAVRETWARDAMGTPFRGQQRHPGQQSRKNGELFDVECFANDIVFRGKPARLVLAIDVTEQRRAALGLRRSEARFRALTDLSADWFWEQDENFRFVAVEGSRFPTLLQPGVTILGRTRWELPGSIPQGGWDEHRAQLERHKPFLDFEVARTAPDGSQRFLSLSGTPIFEDDGRFAGYRGVGRDITERRRAEQALSESQRALAALMSNLPGMAYRCGNTPLFPMEFVSEGAYALTGLRPDALLSGAVNYGDLIHPDDRVPLWTRVQEAVARDQPFELTYRITAADGGEKWVWERGGAVRNAQGEVVALEGFISDVTERRQAQEEVARLNAELEERVRHRTEQLQAANAELEAFAYSIAHDLRSPLTSIDGFSHSLIELCAQALGEQGRHYLGRIRAGVRQMSDLTDAMLSLARLSRVKLRWETVDLAALARATVTQLGEGEPGRDTRLDAPAHLYAQGDPRLLAQVVANLVGNAWKFSAAKPLTRITLGTQPGEHGEVVYFVADQGAGFDMAHASRLFGAFQRLHSPSEFEGTGIGLALVQKIVSRHGGRIWAQARPGDGATFFFTLGEGHPDGEAMHPG
jgi:PAS domain S-box-containing protein